MQVKLLPGQPTSPVKVPGFDPGSVPGMSGETANDGSCPCCSRRSLAPGPGLLPLGTDSAMGGVGGKTRRQSL